MALKLIIVTNILLVFFILRLCEAQDKTEELDFNTTAHEFVIVTPYKENTLNVTWNIANKHNLKANDSFNIIYWKRDDETSNHLVKQYTLDSTVPPRLWTLLMGLEPNTFYFVKVVFSNNSIEESKSEPVLGHTYRKAPTKSPTSIRIFAINDTTIKVAWHPIQTSIDEEPVEGYKIRIWEDDQIKSVVRDIIVPGDVKLEEYVNNLKYGKVYDLRVLAFSKAGDGKLSTPPYSFSLRPLESQ